MIQPVGEFKIEISRDYKIHLCAAKEDTRPILENVVFGYRGGMSYAASASGFHLAAVPCKIEGLDPADRILIHSRIIRRFMAALPAFGGEGKVRLQVTIQGRFPIHDGVASTVSGEEPINQVSCHVRSEKMIAEVEWEISEYPDFFPIIPEKPTGAVLVNGISFNADYMADCAKACGKKPNLPGVWNIQTVPDTHRPSCYFLGSRGDVGKIPVAVVMALHFDDRSFDKPEKPV